MTGAYKLGVMRCPFLVPQTHDSEQRLWMEENVLGTLVPALQELIQAVRMKQEEEQDPHAILTPPLNPIDWLASLLMRNNPKHNINATKHPYYQLLQDHVRRVRALNNAATQGERDRAEAQRLEEARRQEEEVRSGTGISGWSRLQNLCAEKIFLSCFKVCQIVPALLPCQLRRFLHLA